MRVTVIALLLAGCATLEQGAARVAGAGVDAVIQAVRRELGREPGDLPTVCETELDPETGRLLLLCTVCYRLRDGERCE